MRQSWIYGINGVEKTSAGGLKKWIENASYRVITANQTNGIVLHYDPEQDILPFLAFDIDRMQSASLESAAGAIEHSALGRSLAWLVVRLYYSAFYAAHSLIRIGGQSCTVFEDSQKNELSRIVQAYGFPNNLVTTGLHYIQIDPQSRQVFIKKMRTRPGLGSHANVWEIHKNWALEAINKVNAGYSLIEYQATFETQMNACLAITSRDRNGRGIWLSQIRNDVNYQHTHGVWYPYTHKLDLDVIKRSASNSIRIDPMNVDFTSKNEIEAFVKAAAFIIGISNVTSADLAEKKVGKHSFFNAGTNPLRRLLRAAH